MKTSISSKVIVASTTIIALILVLIPFHAFLTVWLSTILGHYNLLRVWKEGLVVLLLVAAFYVLRRDMRLWLEVRKSWLFRAIAVYVGLHLLLGGIAFARHQVNGTALVYALIVNLRLVLFFFVTWVFASKSVWLRQHVQKLLIIPLALVVFFGLLQAFVLPANTLQHIGYGPATIMPYETVDQKVQYIRVQSTLRGPNPLGAYLVVAIIVLTAVILKVRTDKKELYTKLALALAALAGLYFTYSRSAYIGLFVSGVVLGWSLLRSKRTKKILLVGVAAVCVIGAVAGVALRHNDQFQNTFFHTDEHSKSSLSSNQARGSALKSASHDVLHEPLGRGPGTAGPASEHNDHPARIAENYYLQIGQELGWVGLFLFLSINVFVAKQLWVLRKDWLAAALLASLCGISAINMLSLAWTDDTLAIIWWGIAGIVLAPDILKRKE